MKIGIIGATGRQGRLILEEAHARGHEVTAIIRNPAKLADKKVAIIERDIFDVQLEDLKGFDVIVDAFNAPAGMEEEHVTSLQSLIDELEHLPETRLIVVGGAGSLYADPGKTIRVMETANFPEAFKPTAKNMAKALSLLKESKVNWTYLSSSAYFDPNGNRTGKYAEGAETLLLNSEGESYISYADYGIALVDEIERQRHLRQRYTVVGERQ